MDPREKFAMCLNEFLEAAKDVGWPILVAVQNQEERKELFPGILSFYIPPGTDTSMVFAGMILKEGIDKGLTTMIPGLKAAKLEKSLYQTKLAEDEQGDHKVTQGEIRVPKHYLSLNDKEYIDG